MFLRLPDSSCPGPAKSRSGFPSCHRTFHGRAVKCYGDELPLSRYGKNIFMRKGQRFSCASSGRCHAGRHDWPCGAAPGSGDGSRNRYSTARASDAGPRQGDSQEAGDPGEVRRKQGAHSQPPARGTGRPPAAEGLPLPPPARNSGPRSRRASRAAPARFFSQRQAGAIPGSFPAHLSQTSSRPVHPSPGSQHDPVPFPGAPVAGGWGRYRNRRGGMTAAAGPRTAVPPYPRGPTPPGPGPCCHSSCCHDVTYRRLTAHLTGLTRR